MALHHAHAHLTPLTRLIFPHRRSTVLVDPSPQDTDGPTLLLPVPAPLALSPPSPLVRLTGAAAPTAGTSPPALSDGLTTSLAAPPPVLAIPTEPSQPGWRAYFDELLACSPSVALPDLPPETGLLLPNVQPAVAPLDPHAATPGGSGNADTSANFLRPLRLTRTCTRALRSACLLSVPAARRRRPATSPCLPSRGDGDGGVIRLSDVDDDDAVGGDTDTEGEETDPCDAPVLEDDPDDDDVAPVEAGVTGEPSPTPAAGGPAGRLLHGLVVADAVPPPNHNRMPARVAATATARAAAKPGSTPPPPPPRGVVAAAAAVAATAAAGEQDAYHTCRSPAMGRLTPPAQPGRQRT